MALVLSRILSLRGCISSKNKFYVRIINMQTLMNALRKLTIVPTTVITLMAILHAVVGMAIDYLMMVAPALVSHLFTVDNIIFIQRV